MTSNQAWRTAALVAALMVVPATVAGGKTVVVSTGLRTALPGNIFQVTFEDASTVEGGTVSVHLTLLDARNRVLAQSEGPVRAGEPLVLRWSGSSVSTQVRAVAKFTPTGTPATDLRAPSMSAESWNPSANNNLVNVTCPMKGPDTNGFGDPPIGMCDDGSFPRWFLPWSTSGPCTVEVLDALATP